MAEIYPLDVDLKQVSDYPVICRLLSSKDEIMKEPNVCKLSKLTDEAFE